eukprot:scaffold159408_cov34-Tisochrysis_lutea.AAC.2
MRRALEMEQAGLGRGMCTTLPNVWCRMSPRGDNSVANCARLHSRLGKRVERTARLDWMNWE